MLFGIFSLTKPKLKKWKSRFRYINYIVLLGSPGWKQWEKFRETAMKKTSIFHETSIPNRVKKLSQTKHAIKITQKTRPAPLWRSTGRFLVNLGSPRGPQNRRFGVGHSGFCPSWNQPGSILGAKLHFLGFWLCFSSILALFGAAQGSILDWFSPTLQASKPPKLGRRNARSVWIRRTPAAC